MGRCAGNPGKYYAWAEKESKTSYTWDNYSQYISNLKYYNFGYTNREYNYDGWDSDADLIYGGEVGEAYNVGIPTKDEFTELVNNCTLAEATVNGMKGVRFTSKKNSKSIFLPYSGSYYDSSTPASGTFTYYWTSTNISSQKAYAAGLASGKLTATQCQKRTGMPYRSVARFEGIVDEGYYDDDWSNSGQFAVDGINNIKSLTPTDDAIYTLQGVKVEGKPQPGVYVKNGRKVVVT